MSVTRALPTLVVSLLATLAAAASVHGASSPAPNAHPFAGETAWIAYQTDRGGSEGVWLVHPDGSDDHEVAVDVPGGHVLPDWSPDGARLTFTTRGGETEPLFEFDLATGQSRQLFECVDPCVGDDEPAYSPDESRVAFVRALGPFTDTGPSDCGLWIGDIVTGTVSQITSNRGCDREYFPRWSPDGSRLTYSRATYDATGTTGSAVFTIDVDGTDETAQTSMDSFAGAPDWSPDGEWIAFSTYPLNEFQCCEVSNLYRIHPDGSGLEALTTYTTDDLRATQPRYTPDGDWIVFTAVTPTSRSLWAMPSDGGEPIALVQGGIYTHGTWQP